MALPSIHPYALPAAFPSVTVANRVDWDLNPERSVLLIHDMQRHFVAPFTRTKTAQIDTAIDAIGALRSTASAAGVPTVFTAQPPRQDPADRGLLSDMWGPGLMTDDSAAIIDELTPNDDDHVFTKWRYSAFRRSHLRDWMHARSRDQLVVTGVYSHIGCLATALDAFMLDVQVFFALDAQADFSLDEHLMAANHVAQRCGLVTTTDRVLDAFRRPTRTLGASESAEHPGNSANRNDGDAATSTNAPSSARESAPDLVGVARTVQADPL